MIFIAVRLLPENRYQELTQLFKMLDADSDGYLMKEELQSNVKDYIGNDENVLKDLDKMFEIFVNSDGKMSYSDFISAIIELKGEVTEEIIKKAFALIAGFDCKYITRQ